MKLRVDEFRQWKQKSITLLGMSGVGKTHLATMLREAHWFHYSGDYRIGTRYLGEAILDEVKKQAMQLPFLRDLLRSDSIYLGNNITVDHLKPLSAFLGKLGNPELGGLALSEFKRRQRLHHQAEVAAMLDVPDFIAKARSIYGYDHFINDVGGSLCELDDPRVLEVLAQNSMIVYIKAGHVDEEKLIARAVKNPKPLYYREAFLDEQLAVYCEEKGLEYIALIDPDDFVRWVFPKLFRSRLPRYESIAAQYGYTVDAADVFNVSSEAEFLALLEDAIVRRDS
ncbi:ATPase [Granulosicoccaceae sp. 1_MG-2023]|nr:ATPase [Granulosicoccaceae sp. 1_MG-2023]